MRTARVVAFVVLCGLGLIYGWAARDGLQGFNRNLDARARVTALIRPDGVVEVTEDLDLDASHLEDGAVERLVPYSKVRVIGVSDGQGAAVPVTSGTNGSGTRIQFTSPARGHQRFLIRYEIEDRVRAFADVAQFSVRWFSRQNQLAMEDLQIEVRWAEGVGGAVLASGVVRPEGPLPQRRSLLQGSEARTLWNAGRIPADAEVNHRVALPVAAVPGVERSPRSVLGSLRAQEDQAAEEVRRSRVGATAMSAAAALVAVGLLAGWAALQRAFGREYPVEQPTYERDLPSGHSPAEVGWLLRFGEVQQQDVLATVLDLSRRGHFDMVDRDGTTVLLATPGRGRSDRLRDYERDVLAWLFPEGRTEVPFSDRALDIFRSHLQLDGAGARAAAEDPTGFAGLFGRFVADVDAAGQADGLIERKAGAGPIVLLRFIGLGAVALGAIAMGLGALAAPALIASGALVTAFAGALTRRTREGARLAARWQAFARFLRDYSVLDEKPPGAVVLWEHYLAYAVSLGQASTVVAILSRFPAREGWKTLIDHMNVKTRSWSP